MKNKIMYSVFLLIVLLALSTNIYAVDVGGDYSGGSIADFDQGGGKTNWPYPYVAGIRINFVAADGRRIGNDLTFIYDSDLNLISGKQVKVPASMCSRATYANGLCSLSWTTRSVGDVAFPLSSASAFFTADGGGQRVTFNVPFMTAVPNRNYSNLFDSLLREKNTNLDDTTYHTATYNLFNALVGAAGGGTLNEHMINDTKTNTPVYNIFMTFEPVTVIKYNGTLYMGTAYELAAEGRKHSGGGFTSKCNGSSTGALCDVSTVLRKSEPCSSYLDGSIFAQLQERGSSLAPYFQGGYFNGALKINYNSYSSQCSSKSGRIDANDASNPGYGVGIGVIWLGNFVNEVASSCDTIYEGLPKNWETTLKNYYEQGGIQKIYSSYNAPTSDFPYGSISYLDKAGVTQQADLKWFVNECTCYGMYDYYANNRMKAYYTSNYATINELSRNVFKNNNWFTLVKLSDTKGWLLKNKIAAGTLYDYNLENATYAKSHNLSWTPVTIAKYTENLKCGTTETYWCDEFDDWYTKNKPSGYPNISTIKNSSTNTIMRRYETQMTNMINAYNLIYYPAMGFKWTLSPDDEKNTSNTQSGNAVFSYITQCTKNNVSCSTVNSFYANRGTDLTKMSCSSIESFNFSQFNNQYNTDINGTWYTANCGCNGSGPVVYNCTPKYNVGTCINGDNISYLDSAEGKISDEYWKNCVFDDFGDYDIDIHKEANKDSHLTYYEKGLGSQYCEVYCIEELTTNFATNNITVNAGNNFTWGFSSVTGGRTCKTKTVEWDQFTKDLDYWNIEIERAYNEYLVARDQQDSVTDYDITDGCSECVSWDEVCTTNKDGEESCHDVCDGWNYWDEECIEWDSASYGSGPTYEYGSAGSDCSCSGRPSHNRFGKSSKYSYYTSIKNKSIDTYNAMLSCYNWNNNVIYNGDPKAIVSYSDGTLYNYRDDLERTKVKDNTTSKLNCTPTKQIDVLTSCGGNSCTTSSKPIRECEDVTMERTQVYQFSLQDDVFRYVLKSNNLSIHPNDLDANKLADFTTNYTDLKYSNFPVAYKTPDGTYGIAAGKGDLSIYYSNLGHNRSGETKTAVDTILSTIEAEKYGKWECEFQVYSHLIPDPDDRDETGDIRVVYREIDLKDPFPDIDGSKRNTGSNWCDYEGNCKYNNLAVQDYITNNRGVDDNELYNNEPMYTFTLTPTIVREIRNYNTQNSYTSYTGSLNGKNYDYVCKKGQGGTCISEYLSYMIDITGAKEKPGTCVEDKYRSSSDSSNFESCRY